MVSQIRTGLRGILSLRQTAILAPMADTIELVRLKSRWMELDCIRGYRRCCIEVTQHITRPLSRDGNHDGLCKTPSAIEHSEPLFDMIVLETIYGTSTLKTAIYYLLPLTSTFT